MKHLEEENKNLISLRTSLVPVIVVLTGGIIGIILSDINIILKVILLILGSYFEYLFIGNIVYANNKISENIGEIKNECK